MFKKILIANRGEIAVRIIKTCRGWASGRCWLLRRRHRVLAYEMADETIHIGPSPAAQSYLIRQDRRRSAQSGAEAVHPGFGFLSENPVFARRLRRRGHHLHRPQSVCDRGDGRQDHVQEVRGRGRRLDRARLYGSDRRPEHAVQIAAEIGYPVMIKASAGRRRQGHPRRLEPTGRRGGLPAVKAEALGPSATTGSSSRSSSSEPAPHRDPGAGRQARQRRPPVRARMLDPAPQPEGHRGGAVAAARRGDPRR
jgi:propionyl-CoA carboxylase alpha chain